VNLSSQLVIKAGVGVLVIGFLIVGYFTIIRPEEVHSVGEASSAASGDSVQALISKEEVLNDRCRGGSGDDPETNKSCAERDAAVEQLKLAGWCWGTDNQVEADKKWQRCEAPASMSTSSADPYAAGQAALANSEYQQSKADLISEVQTAYYAAHCRVIQGIEAQMILQTGVTRISRLELDAGRSDYHPELLPALKAAAEAAVMRAKQPGACDYWKESPEAVAEIRRLGELALMQ
jgi:hypothetical protein